jgi:hypothetical protein
MLPFHKNPILYREFRPRVRPSKLLAWAVALSGFLTLTLTYIILTVAERRDDVLVIKWPHVWMDFADAVMAVQVFCGFYVTLALAANSIAREKAGRTYDFLTTLPIGPADKAAALALGTNLYSVMILIATVPIVLAAGLAGGYALATLLWFIAMLVAYFLAAGMIGVALGSGLTGGIVAWLIVLVVLAYDLSLRGLVTYPHFAITPLVSLAPYATRTALLDFPKVGHVFLPGHHHFFFWPVPWQVCPLSFLAFLWVLSFALAGRKLSRPGAPPLPRLVVVVAFVVFQAMAVGFLADAVRGIEEPHYLVGVFYMLNFLLILLWAMSVQPTYAGLMAWIGRGRFWLGRLVSQSVTTVLSPSLLAAAVMWIVAVAGIWSMDRIYWKYIPWQRILGVGGILLMFMLAYQSLFTVGCTASRRNGKALGLILVAVAVAVPAVFSTLKDQETLLNATPMSVLSQAHHLLDPQRAWLEEPSLWWSLSFAITELAVFGGLCLIALAALARRAPGPASPHPSAAGGEA